MFHDNEYSNDSFFSLQPGLTPFVLFIKKLPKKSDVTYNLFAGHFIWEWWKGHVSVFLTWAFLSTGPQWGNDLNSSTSVGGL
jgi:hypothetical protein